MNDKSERAQREEEILKFWKENKIFEKTLEKKAPKGDFVFYEGPPTANGRPGIHHLEARAFKDAIPRYKTMRGYRVPRKGGWDTHGLPVELEVEKQLGLKSKREIENFGIAKFNEECKKSVWKYVDEWKSFTDRAGYWVDLENAYVTYNTSYIEALWSVLSHIEKRGLLYKDYKVLPWCPRCGTALSSHELAQGYQDVKDISFYVKFKIREKENTYFLAWTTTPWTLPGNVALAVGNDIDYVQIRLGEEQFILAEKRLSVVVEHYEIIGKMKGSELVGVVYEPLYEFSPKNENSHKVYAADFVNTEDGTGVVHTAVMYGQDDFLLGSKVGLPKQHLVDDTGHFKSDTGFLAGKSVVEESTVVEILKDLQTRGLLFNKESYTHSYPFCWRCKTRLIYYARDSWYIAMSKLRDELVQENKKINWVPEYIREGRFGEWLNDVKDWAISRERYWGTPLPIWKDSEGKVCVIGSLEELKKFTKKSGNKYFVMRHAEAANNAKRILDLVGDPENHLTEKGREEAKQSALDLRGKKIDLIVASPFLRTRETAEILQKELGLSEEQVVIDERLHEIGEGEEGPSVRCRMGASIFDMEKKYKGKNILIISHGYPIWNLLQVMNCAHDDWKAMVTQLKTAEVKEVPFVPYPHNENYELDLHRPYIDEIVLVKDGEEYRRVKEVMDVWFDSGAMPFAQDPSNVLYPADFISEAIDQTRGWFYTLHAIGILMQKGRAYKSVISLGHILDKEGKKMSKSVGNVVNPWEMMDKYGVDTLRLWMYSVNQPGESKNFDERTVDEQKKTLNLLENIHSFYELYRDKKIETEDFKSGDILDQWIIARLNQLIKEMTTKLDDYKLLEPVRALREFVDDFSTWYLQRSRERIKDGDKEAKQTLYFVLKKVSRLLAPFAPFIAENLYQKLRTETEPESVHLCTWPEEKRSIFSFFTSDVGILNKMEETRKIASLGLQERQKAGINVRQPVAKVFTLNKVASEFGQYILRDALNTAVVEYAPSLKKEVEIDTNLTTQLIEEGKLRNTIRAVQEWRKERGLNPGEKASYTIPEQDREIFAKYSEEIKKATNVEF